MINQERIQKVMKTEQSASSNDDDEDDCDFIKEGESCDLSKSFKSSGTEIEPIHNNTSPSCEEKKTTSINDDKEDQSEEAAYNVLAEKPES